MGSIKVFLDTDVLINWLSGEVNSDTGFELWKAPHEIIALVEKEKIIAYTSLINIFEIRFVLRRKKNFAEGKIKEFVSDLYGYINVEVPDSIDMMIANKSQEERLLDPFDAIAYSIAAAISSDYIITRDKEFIDIVNSLNFAALTPEEFMEKYFTK